MQKAVDLKRHSADGANSFKSDNVRNIKYNWVVFLSIAQKVSQDSE